MKKVFVELKAAFFSDALMYKNKSILGLKK